MPPPSTPLDLESSLALAALVEHGALAVATVREGVVVSANPPFQALFGLTATGVGVGELAAAAERERAVAEVARVGASGQLGRIVFHARRADGTPFKVELAGAPLATTEGPALAVIATDITEQSRAQEQLSYMAYLDPLTGLPNRALLLDRVQQALAQSQRSPRTFALFIADLDGFKQVNDQRGHETGDAVLQAVAQRLGDCVRESDTVARLGGDEFAVLLPRIAKRDDAALVAGRMIRSLSEPIVVAGEPCTVGISIGIATSPDDGTDLDGLLARADVAMYESKRGGKSRYSFAERGSAPHPVSIPFLVWTVGFEVGFAAIDQDHRALVTVINRLGEELKASYDRDRLLATLAELVAETERHFDNEGRLLDAVPELPSATEHREAHRRLLDDLRSLTVSVDARSMSLTMRFLQEWLLRHIRSLDAELARGLNARGVRGA